LTFFLTPFKKLLHLSGLVSRTIITFRHFWLCVLHFDLGIHGILSSVSSLLHAFSICKKIINMVNPL